MNKITIELDTSLISQKVLSGAFTPIERTNTQNPTKKQQTNHTWKNTIALGQAGIGKPRPL